jgi:small nuclear ribonucleoprotein (snRNP)-like protein
MSGGVGVPVKLLGEAESHVITIELKTGEVYRGTLEACEDSMNCQLRGVIHTGRDGRVSKCVFKQLKRDLAMGSCSRLGPSQRPNGD